MEIDFLKIIENVKSLGDIDDDLIITGDTALAVYEINNKYILPPYDVINKKSKELDESKYWENQFAQKIYLDDLFVIDSIKITSPGKAMLDVMLSGREGEMYELLDEIDNTIHSFTLRNYIKKYKFEEIMKNIMHHYRLEDFRHILDINK